MTALVALAIGSDSPEWVMPSRHRGYAEIVFEDVCKSGDIDELMREGSGHADDWKEISRSHLAAV